MDLKTFSNVHLRVFSALAILEAMQAYLDNMILETVVDNAFLERVTCITGKALEDIREAVRILEE